MTKQNKNTDALQYGCSALLYLALCIAPAHAELPATFVLQPSGFPHAMVADDQGQLIQTWPGQPQPLSLDHWLAVDFDSSHSVWFDTTGHITQQGRYVEIRSDALQRHPQDPDQTAVFSAWSEAGTGLLRADGTPFQEWQPERGEWSITPHPQRYSWRSREGGERIFDEKGTLRIQLAANERRAAGPFPGSTHYLVCDLATQAPCTLRDEAGTARWSGNIGDLVPLEKGGWLGREGSAWRRLDEDGHLGGDRSLVYLPKLPLSGAGGEADDVVTSWPRWMTEYRIAHEDEATFSVLADSETGGLMQHDGRFVPVQGATSGEELCPGIWRFKMQAGEDRLGSADGRILGDFNAFSWKELEGRPEQRIAVADNGQETLIDCHGRPLVKTPPLIRLTAETTGLLGTLVNESEPRLWVDAELRQHLLPEGAEIEKASRTGTYLIVETADGYRLYHVQRATYVGNAFTSAEALTDSGVVFFRDGYHGFMDIDGIERIPPRYNGVMAWGEDRLWTWRYLEDDALNRQEVSLHRIDGAVIKRWKGVTASDSPMMRNLPNQGPVTQLIGPTIDTEKGSYFGQQWVDRDGRTLFLAVECSGTRGEDKGAVMEPLKGRPQRHGAGCEIPDAVRAAMAL